MIKAICDIDVDAVWVESDIELPFLNEIQIGATYKTGSVN